MNILQVEQLSKTYGTGDARVDALRGVSMSLAEGEFAAVVGESGSGKSTLLNIIGGLDAPTSGRVRIGGDDLFEMDEERRTVFRRRNIGFVFQSFRLIPELTVEQNILFPLLLDRRGTNKGAALLDRQCPDAGSVEALLALLGLTDRRRHLPGQLSGGQQQRVAIGRALAARPKLLLADEPTGNLDSKNSREVLGLLLEASKKRNQTVLMITHSDALAAAADRVFVMADGQLAEKGGKRA